MTSLAGSAPERQVFIPLHAGPDACRPPPQGAARFALSGDTMGTYWKVAFHARPPEARLAGLRQAIEACLEGVIREMSPWDPGSAISRFNAAPAGTWQPLPAGFAHVLGRALEIAALTGGAYDPTLGAVTDAWGFGPAGRIPHRPGIDCLERLESRAGYRRLTFNRETAHVLQPGGLCLDLCSIAKGYAVDQLSRLLREKGHESHLVEIGGELFGHGLKPYGTPWWVSLGEGNAPSWAALTGMGIATSGSSVRFMRDGGRHYSHVLDGRRGAPVEDATFQVTVLAQSCMEADGMATALLALGPARATEFAARHGIAALFLTDGTETFSPALETMR